MRYKKVVYCDICGKPMIMPTGRIEWYGEWNEIHICHHDCSWARNGTPINFLDMEFVEAN